MVANYITMDTVSEVIRVHINANKSDMDLPVIERLAVHNQVNPQFAAAKLIINITTLPHITRW